MADDIEPQTPIHLRHRRAAPDGTLSPARLMALIRFRAEHSGMVIFGEHAQERMEERNISDEDVFAVLRIGELTGRISKGIDPGEWKCKVVAKPRGSRRIGVVTIVLLDEMLFIKTVEWEDR